MTIRNDDIVRGVREPETVLEYLLSNQSSLVTKISELEKSTAVVAVEIRMMRELLEKQAKMEDRLRQLEDDNTTRKGQGGVHLWIVNSIAPVILSIIATLIVGSRF